MASRCKTKFLEGAVENDTALSLYTILRDTIEWEEGIRSRKGFTRKAKAIGHGTNPLILEVIDETLKKITDTEYYIDHVYLNYYENGQMWTPNHNHPGTHQLVISLGCERVLELGKKQYKMKNGDAIIFGSSTHGVPKDEECTEGRISIATFMKPLIERKGRSPPSQLLGTLDITRPKNNEDYTILFNDRGDFLGIFQL